METIVAFVYQQQQEKQTKSSYGTQNSTFEFFPYNLTNAYRGKEEVNKIVIGYVTLQQA